MTDKLAPSEIETLRGVMAHFNPHDSDPLAKDIKDALAILDRLSPPAPEVDEATVWTRKIWGTEDDGAYDHDTVFQETRAVIAELLASKDAEIEQWKSQERVAFEHQQKAESELAAVSAAIGTTEFMDPPDGGSPTLAEQVGRMRAELAALRAENERLKADNLKHLEELFDRISAMDEIAKGVHGQGPNWFDECQRRIDLARNWRNLSKTAERNQAVAVGHLYDKSGRRTNAPFMAVVLPSGGVTKAAERNTAEPATDTTPEVVVTQGAREAAVALMRKVGVKSEYLTEIEAGSYDESFYVIAIAEAEARGRREALDEVITKIGSMKTGRTQPIVMTCAEIIDELKRMMTGGK